MRNDTPKSLIIKSFCLLIGGIVRLALRNGINFKEFSNLCKTVYVDIASQDYGIEGRPTNLSRIALMTGLDRREIKRISDAIQNQDDISNPKSPDKMSKILAGWFSDETYLDPQGTPLELPAEGPAPSFESLVKTYGGDVAAVTVLREFKRSLTVVDTESGKLKANARYYIPNYQASTDKAPEPISPEAIEHGGSMLIDHINTIFHNLYREDMNTRERFEIRATNTAIDKTKVDEFYQLIDEQGEKFLVEIDQWLDEHQVDDLSIPHERLGACLYLIHGKNKPINKE